ncbi:thiamine diphosphokinase [Actibacterium pelagium]|uniref:Thiamine diphosphokinase n=1 Tax=Actibacterium pelagium TaxID=2029103 RepID=A0A917EJJ1_9RHOB|nr:thiamine diphosphokinase [Actibacterium pelagium]GGE51318.1 thiamine pyrophosphokinase [Actibacterium pelagium]
MSDALLETNCFVTLLGAGDASKEDISTALALAPELVAADGGANRAFEYGIPPRWVVGDMDSILPETRSSLDDSAFVEIPEQDSTDFDKCLRVVQAPLIIAVGFTGDRLDHQLAVFSGLLRQPERKCIVLGAGDLIFHCPHRLHLALPVGTRVSLFPLQEVGGTSQGLQWPIDELRLSPGGMIGTSNKTTEPVVQVAPDGDGLLVILPREFLPQVVKALQADD